MERGLKDTVLQTIHQAPIETASQASDTAAYSVETSVGSVEADCLRAELSTADRLLLQLRRKLLDTSSQAHRTAELQFS